MKLSRKKKRPIPPALKRQMADLEEKIAEKGIHVHYDLLEAAGLKLKGGICKIRDELHLFIERRKSPAEKIEILQDYVDNPLPEDIPENLPQTVHESNEPEETHD